MVLVLYLFNIIRSFIGNTGKRKIGKRTGDRGPLVTKRKTVRSKWKRSNSICTLVCYTIRRIRPNKTNYISKTLGRHNNKTSHQKRKNNYSS